MKNVGMTLFFFFSLAITQLSAQSCPPSPNCPPACCVKTCTPDGKSAAVDNKTTTVAGLMATCTPAQLEACKTAAGTSGCSKSGKSAALTTTGKATTVANKTTGGQAKAGCTQPCTKPASTLEQ
ncbi:MAG: hypothetical protein HUU01_09465 [Saprospiraceae bacterium]|nr:hypothetical protein [Saprospiraceae bacterium]